MACIYIGELRSYWTSSNFSYPRFSIFAFSIQILCVFFYQIFSMLYLVIYILLQKFFFIVPRFSDLFQFDRRTDVYLAYLPTYSKLRKTGWKLFSVVPGGKGYPKRQNIPTTANIVLSFYRSKAFAKVKLNKLFSPRLCLLLLINNGRYTLREIVLLLRPDMFFI